MAKKGDQIKFVRGIGTQINPKDVFFRNEEHLTRNYFAIMFIAMLMMGYALLL